MISRSRCASVESAHFVRMLVKACYEAKARKVIKKNLQPTIIIIYLTFLRNTITFMDNSLQFKPFLSLCLRLKIYMIL